MGIDIFIVFLPVSYMFSQLRVLCNVLGVWPSTLLDFIAVQLYISPPIINPLLYGLFRQKFRERFVKLLRRVTGGCVANKVRPVEILPTRSGQSDPDESQ